MALLLFVTMLYFIIFWAFCLIHPRLRIPRMDIYDHDIRYQSKNNASYSSLPAGLEIAVAPSCEMSPPVKTSLYTYKPLPALPTLPRKVSDQRLEQNKSSNSLDVTSKRRLSTFPIIKRGGDQSGSSKKRGNLFGLKLDRVTRQAPLGEVARNGIQGGPPQLPEITGLSTADHHYHVDGFSDVRQFMRPDSQYSLGSSSEYSQDDVVEEIVDIYSKWGSWAPNPDSSTLPVKRSLYLQPSIYSASATEFGHASHTSNVRRPSRASLDSAQIFPKATTLAELVKEERECFRGSGRFSQEGWVTPYHNQTSLEAKRSVCPPWNEGTVRKSDFLPQPLVLRPKNSHDPHRSMSRWSDHSSDGGMISNARDSVISHIRSMSSPFKVPSRPSVVFQEIALASTIQVHPPEQNTRKRAFSSGKHPLKSPFPFRSPLHKKTHFDDSRTPKHSNFAHPISDNFKHFSEPRDPPIVNSQIISNHSRTADGPDTPRPTKPGLMGMISPTTILFQKGTLRIRDAIQKAKRVRKVRSRDERRRDKLRENIVVVGTANMSPPVSRWV